MSAAAHWAWLESLGLPAVNRKLVRVRPYALFLAPPPGARILDVGAYLGANLLHYGRLGFACVGVEACGLYCQRFEEEYAKAPFVPRPQMWHGLVEDFEPTQPFDAALCGEALCYSPEPATMAGHVLRCVRPGGVALFTMPAYPQKEFPTHLELCELADLLTAAGLTVSETLVLGGQGNTPCNAVRGYKERT